MSGETMSERRTNPTVWRRVLASDVGLPLSLRSRGAPMVTRSRVLTSAAAGLALLVTAAGVTSDAQAAFPGSNGRLAFSAPGVVATVDEHLGDYRRLGDSSYCDGDCEMRSPDWSPDGHQVVWVNEGEAAYRVMVADADGAHRHVVFRGGLITATAWSPDGHRIAFVRYRWPRSAPDYRSDIWVMRADGSHLRRITDTPRVSEDEVDWSSRGLLVFRASIGRFATQRYELYTMRPDGTRRRRITENRVSDRHPEWSPGGGRLLFVRDAAVWRMGASGRHATRLGLGNNPAWSPDGSLIACVYGGKILTMTTDGGERTVLGNPSPNGGVQDVDWQPVP
jgi:Tol biopolymer transport system component